MPTFAEQAAAGMARGGGVPAQLQMGRDKIQAAQFAAQQAAQQRAQEYAAQQDMARMQLDQERMAQQQAQFEAGQGLQREKMGVQQGQFGQEFGLREGAAGRAQQLQEMDIMDRQREQGVDVALGAMYGEMDLEGSTNAFLQSPEAQYIAGLQVDPGTKSMMMDRAFDQWTKLNPTTGGGGFRDMIYNRTLSAGGTDAEATVNANNAMGGVQGVEGGIWFVNEQGEPDVRLPAGAAPAVETLATAEERGKGVGKAAAVPTIRSAAREQDKIDAGPIMTRNYNVGIEKMGTIEQKIAQAKGQSTAFTTGMLGGVLSRLYGTPAYDLRKNLDTLKASAGFDKLAEMRDSNPAGGALGQVSERELTLLIASWQSLEQSQSKEQFEQNLTSFERQVKASWKQVQDQYNAEYGPLIQAGKVQPFGAAAGGGGADPYAAYR